MLGNVLLKPIAFLEINSEVHLCGDLTQVKESCLQCLHVFGAQSHIVLVCSDLHVRIEVHEFS